MKNTLLRSWHSMGGVPAGLRHFRLALPLAGVLLMHGTAQADDAAANLPTQYFYLPNLYDTLSFSLEPLQTFESPDPERYRDLSVALHDGKVRLGLISDYDIANRDQPDARVQAKLNVRRRLIAEREVYLGLLALQYGADYFTPENLLQDDPGSRSNRYMTIGSFAPRGYVGALANNVFQQPYFKAAFCREAPSCWNPEYRVLQRMGVGPMGSMAGRWGGGQDEFAGRSAVEEFIAKDLQPLLSWSKSLPTEVSLVGQTRLTEYDFARGGFPLHVALPKEGSFRSANDIGYAYYEPADAKIKVVGSRGGRVTAALLPLAAGPAEALIEELKAAPGIDNLFFAVQGRIVNVALNEPDFGSGRFSLLYELVSADIVFYKDLALTQPLGTATLQIPQ